MTSPPGIGSVDVVETHAEAEHLPLPPLIVMEGLEPFVPGHGPIAVERLGSGHSNETFRISRSGRSWALRRPPRPPVPPTAHDVVREHRIIAALADSNVRAPRPAAVCEDPTLIGAPFYMMELVEGAVIRDRMPPELDDPGGRREAVEDFVDALVEIHAVDWRGSALERIGRPNGYLERQVRRWKSQWEHNRTRPIREIETIGAWLAERLPQSRETTLVHGDYKIDNAIFHRRRPARVAAIVDWEMATLGDPLADVGLLCGTYVEPGEEPDQVLGFSPATAQPGSPTREDIVERYARASGRDITGLQWYEVLALWKIAILLEGSYKRYLAGTTSDPFFTRLADGIPRLALTALQLTRSPKL